MLQKVSAEWYLLLVRLALPCPWKSKRRLMPRIREQVGSFLEAQPEAGYQSLVERFGQPEQIAAAYVESADIGELLTGLHFGGRVVRTMIALAVAVALIWGIGVSAAVVDGKKSVDGFMTEVIEIIDRSEIFEAEKSNEILGRKDVQ